jgi:phage-related baseplate assembly protein
VPVQVIASIKVVTGHDNTTVQARVLSALKQYLAFDNLDLGQPIHLSEVMAVLNAVTGVEAVDVDQLQYMNAADRVSHGANADAVQAHLLIFPNELATVSNSASDLVVKIGLSQT